MSSELAVLKLQIIDKRLKTSARVHGITVQLHGPSNITEVQDLPVGDMWIKTGEILDELIEWIQGLGDRCNFPIDAVKERHIQYQLVYALSGANLIRKLLSMKNEATTAKILVFHTHFVIADNMSYMDVASKTVNVIQKMAKKPSPGKLHKISCAKQGKLPSKGYRLPEVWTLEREARLSPCHKPLLGFPARKFT